MYRPVFFGILLAAAVALPMAAIAKTHSGSVVNKTYSSAGCSAQYSPDDPATWACTTITMPKPVVADRPFKAIFTLMAKKFTLKQINICFTGVQIHKTTCVVKSRHPVNLEKGIIHRWSRTLVVPSGTPPESYLVENNSGFAKASKHVHPGVIYWWTRAMAIVVAPPAA